MHSRSQADRPKVAAWVMEGFIYFYFAAFHGIAILI
jgi:hypothetical protein